MSTRMCCVTLCGLLICAVAASAQTGGGGVSVTGVPGATLTRPVASNAVELMLRNRVESVDWVENTFEEVLDWLRGQGEGHVNVVPRWNHLGVEGVGLDTPVTLQLNNTTVADVLSETLLQVSDTGEVTYQGFGNKLTISTRSDFDRKTYTKVYDVTDILLRVPDFGQAAPLIDLQNTNRSGGGGSGGGGGGGSSRGVFGGGSGGSGQEQEQGGEQAEQDLEQRLTKLREMIEQTIAPTSWDLTGSASAGSVAGGGGGQGRIRVFNRSLVITNTIEVHEMIAGRFGFSERR